MKKLLTLLALAGSLACGFKLPPATTPGTPPSTTPSTPPAAGFKEFTFAVRVHGQGPGVHPLKDCAVTLKLQPAESAFRGTTSSDGYFAVLVRIPEPDPGGWRNMASTIACPGYLLLEDSFVIAGQNQDVTFGGPTAEGNQPVLRPGPLPAPLPFPFPGETSFISVAGKFFKINGQTWAWRGESQFMLFARFLRGEDITPRLVDARKLGFNVLRVFGRVAGSGWPDFADFATPEKDAQYTTKLGAFFDLCAEHGLRVEIVPLTYPDEDGAQRARLQQTYDVAAGRWNVFVEGANEPGVNNIDIVRLYEGVDRKGVVSAYGLYDQTCDGVHICTMPTLDYVTVHTSRGDQWPRQLKDLQEWRDGYGCGDPANKDCNPLQWYGGTHKPTIGDEPIGGDEVSVNGRRSSSASDFAQAFADCAMASAGCTFHSEAGLRSVPFGPKQQAIAEALLEVYKFMPAYVQEGGYGAGHLGNLPVLWPNDTVSLRTFAALFPSEAWAVDIRPVAGRKLEAAPGWRIEATIQNGTIAHLVR